MGSKANRQPLAVVTGASSGIGAAVARRLAERGCRTILIARRAEQLARLAADLSPLAPSVPHPLDLSDDEAIDPALRNLVREHGPVDILVHAAGYNTLRAFLDQRASDMQRLMQVHYFAATQLIRAVLPGMLDQQRGHIITIGSIAAKVGPWGHGGYSAAKAALWSLTQTLAAEYGEQGVHFSYVQPGVVRSAFFDEPSYTAMDAGVHRRAVSCDYVAQRIVRLLDRPRLELIVPRHHRVVDWLKLLCPALVHGLIARQSRPRPAKRQSAGDTAVHSVLEATGSKDE